MMGFRNLQTIYIVETYLDVGCDFPPDMWVEVPISIQSLTMVASHIVDI